MAEAPEPGKKSEAAGGKGRRNDEGRRDAAAPEMLSALSGLLRDKDAGVRSAAAGAVGALGGRAATPTILSLLSAILKESRQAGTGLEDAAYNAELALASHYRHIAAPSSTTPGSSWSLPF